MTTTPDDRPATTASAGEAAPTAAVLDRTLPLFAIFVAFGAVMLAFAYGTVHHRSIAELETNMLSARTHFRINYWFEHGYFASCGLLALPRPNLPPALYSSSSGGPLITGYIVERIYASITGHPSWRLLALHNQVVSLLTSALFALLAFRLARRLGAIPLHALALAVALEAVFFTFPDNLMIYWEITSLGLWFAGASVFLLIEERCSDAPTRSSMLALGGATFFLTYMDYVAGVAFLLSYAVIRIVFIDQRPATKRMIVACLVPMLLAIGVHRGQVAWAKVLHPDIAVLGNGFAYRSGLDGSMQWYGDHLDIAYGRALARANYLPEKIRPLLFRWEWLFFASAAAMIFLLVRAARRKVPRLVMVSLLSLLGAYLVYAAVFSQAVAIHPYYYDFMLFAPLMLALFVLMPAVLESLTDGEGVAVVVAVFLAIWVSMLQMRRYAITYPQEPPVVAKTVK